MFYNSDLSERNHAVATTAITVAVLVVVLKSWCKDNTTFLLSYEMTIVVCIGWNGATFGLSPLGGAVLCKDVLCVIFAG